MKHLRLIFPFLVFFTFILGCTSQSPESGSTETADSPSQNQGAEFASTDTILNPDANQDEGDLETTSDENPPDENNGLPEPDMGDSEINDTLINDTPPALTWQYGGLAIRGTYADADIVKIEDGNYRLYYSAEPEVQGFQGQVYSSISSDGRNWTTEDGTRITWAIFPSVLKLSDGTYRMYFQNQQVIKSAVSRDGISWNEESGTRIDRANNAGLDLENVGAPTVIFTGELYLLVYSGAINERYSQEVPNSDTHLLLWATSEDGINFDKKGIALDSRNSEFQGWLDGPELVEWDDNLLRLYFWSYKGIYHITFENDQFSDNAELDYTTNANTRNMFPENPPGDPTLEKINGEWFMYYGQHTQGIYYAVLPLH